MANRWICLSDAEINQIIPRIQDWPSLVKKLRIRQKRITTSAAKAKGRNLQQFVCQGVSNITGLPYDQQDDSCLIHSREMGQAGTDVVLRGHAQILFPFAIECKASETTSLPEFVRQAKANTKPGLDWLVVHRSRSIPDTLAIMAWETLEKIYKEVLNAKV